MRSVRRRRDDRAKGAEMLEPWHSLAKTRRPANTTPREAARAGTRTTRALTGVLVLATVVGLVPALTPLATLVVVPAMAASVLVGVHVWRPAARLPWQLLAAWAGVGLLGAVVAAFFPDGSVPGELVPLPQYLVAGAALLALDRARRGRVPRSLLGDAAIVGVSAGLVAFAAFVTPVLHEDFTPVARAMRATYPALDAVLLFLVARLGFDGAWRFQAFRLLVLGFAAAMVADLTWAAFDAGLLGEPNGADDIGYLISFAALGLAGLSSSMAALSAPAPATVSPWRRLRLVAIGGSLAVPAALGVAATADSAVEAVVYTSGALALVGLVCWRLVTSVNRHAASEARLAHAAAYDALTGLPNRSSVLAGIETAFLRSAAGTHRGTAVVLLDIDRFKHLNGGWGHAVGDELLVSVASRLSTVDVGLSSVGRISGDEFVIVCTEVPDRETAVTLGHLLLDCFRAPFPLSVGEVIVSASVGVAFAGADRQGHAEQLLRDADTAMHTSKEAGRDRVTLFTEPMRAAVRRRHITEQALRRAVERGQTTMHYQPIVDLATGRTVGLEALMRWFPDGAPIPPAEFIPIAEETGLIVPLGAQALADATRFLALCRAMHPELDLDMSVNLSPRQLREPGLTETIRDAIAVSGIPPHKLCLEITESTMLEGGRTMVDESLAAVRQLGVRIAADDFGTGYSALPYLERFRVSRLKIDLAFVQGLGVSLYDGAIVAGILAIAKSLRLEVIAEGVETPNQAERLRALGCRMAQGFLVAPAMPPDEAMAFLATSPGSVGMSASPRTQPTHRRTAVDLD
jgi:diguanylate cyclase (GGDEF)-like protein